MDNNVKLIEALLESTVRYGLSEMEMVKLKTLDKTSDVVSSLIPHAVVFFILTLFLLFFNLGLAFWLGEIIGNNFYGFFIIAAFYLFIGLVIHLLLHRRIKQKIRNFLIKQIYK